MSASGNVSGTNFIGNIIATTVSATANITGGNILTAGLISATGNITTAGIVNTANIYGATGETIQTGGNNNINLYPGGTGNIVLPSGNTTYINNLPLTPVQNNDAASKYYVDTMSSTGIGYHAAVYAATTTTLATTTGGTITYNNGTAGVGANIVTTGAFNLIDTANVQTANTRILVKNEGNAALNGIYVWSNATVITRSTDADEYGPDSANALSVNDYFFVSNGNVNAGSAFIVNSPTGTITFGTSNITFAQFSSSQTYTSGNGISIAGTVINAKVDGVTTAFDGGGNISVKASANLTTPNIGAATGTSLSVTGAVQAGTTVSATGNVTGGNVLTGGLISATSTITGSSILGSVVSATGNVTGGNILFGAGIVSGTGNIFATAISANVLATTVSSSGNVTAGNILFGAGIVSGTGNVYAGNIILTSGPGQQISVSNGATLQLTGSATVAFASTGSINGSSGNISTPGAISATGNVAGNYILGNGALLTGVITSVANINNGTSNVAIGAANANVTVGVNGTANVAVFASTGEYITGVLSASGNITSGGNIAAGNLSTSGNIVGGGVRSTSSGTAPSNPAVGDFWYNTTTNVQYRYTFDGTSYYWIDDYGSTAGVNGTFNAIINGTSNVTAGINNGNITVGVAGTPNVVTWASTGEYITGVVSASGNVTGGNLSVSTGTITVGNIVNANANGVGNIGSATTYFNTVFAKATSAQYADLAETYSADAEYEPGTLVVFGGTAEITVTDVHQDTRVAGIISTDPAYLMNSTQVGLPVALTGRVPCRVVGAIQKGDRLVTSGIKGVATILDPAKYQPGCIIGKALENYDSDAVGVIEVAVGRY